MQEGETAFSQSIESIDTKAISVQLLTLTLLGYFADLCELS